MQPLAWNPFHKPNVAPLHIISWINNQFSLSCLVLQYLQSEKCIFSQLKGEAPGSLVQYNNKVTTNCRVSK